jgi:predicted esterase
MYLNKLMKLMTALLAAAVLGDAAGMLFQPQAAEVPKVRQARERSEARAGVSTFNRVLAPVKGGAKTRQESAEEKKRTDKAVITSQDLRAGKDENKRYFLIQSSKRAKPLTKGYGLLVVLPGGPGTADFLPFVKRIYKNALPEGYVLAQLVAVKWTEDQEIVWPTAKNRVEDMKFSTEEFVSAVIKEVTGKLKIDPERVFTLTWSSSGPAAYAVSLSTKQVTGSFIAMSVFKPDLLPPLKKAKGHGYFLYHSPDDRLCPYWMAEQAAKELQKSGAKVKLATYEGGHGWRGALYDDIRAGVQWLEKNHASRPQPAKQK